MSKIVAKITFLFITCLLVLLFEACSDEPVNGNNPPSIEFLGMDRDTMVQGITGINNRDSILVFLTFNDIDGDIAGGSSTRNISIVDNRDGFIDPVSFPELPELKKGQKGEMRLAIYTTCCQFPAGLGAGCIVVPGVPDNRYTYDIYIEDEAGNRSNTITTDTITLLCQ